MTRVAILGAGNGGCAAAADLGRRGFDIRLWSRSRERLAPLRERGGVEYTGVLGDGFTPVAVITDDAAEALDGAALAVLTVPAPAHEAVAAVVGPLLGADALLLATPGHTVTVIPSALRRAGVRRPVVGETGTLPYICRMAGPSTVRITVAARHLAFAVFPARETERVRARVAAIYPAIQPVATVLDTLFLYGNAIHHPPATVMNAGRIEATGGDYYHYHDGISPAVGRLVDRLDEERRAVAAALGVLAPRFVDHFFRMGYTTEAARDTGLAYEAFHQSEPDRWIEAPPSLAHRFLDEDVPFGLVPLAELGRFAGVATPGMDHLIHLASVVTGTPYRADGLTLTRMGLAATPRDALERVLAEGLPD
ncbi:MAG: NAD/NADP octopine/nopaline dehydrogenase family protein [Candidatus Rokuibacteriota bacterium]